MNFDYGDIITRSLKMTWKHKSIWGVLSLPILFSFLMLPVFFGIPFLFRSASEDAQLLGLIGAGLIFVVATTFNMFLGALFNAAASLGVLRIEKQQGSLAFLDLLRDAVPYYWRSLGAMLTIQFSIGALISIFFLLSFMLIMVTIGMAAICMQPIFILMTPFIYLVLAVIEAAQMAVIEKELGSWAAVKDAVLVIRQHLWKYVILTMIVYLGASILGGLISFPLMLPFMVIPFGLEILNPDISGQMVAIGIIAFVCLLFPVITLLSGFMSSLFKFTLGFAYLRLAAGDGAVISVDGLN